MAENRGKKFENVIKEAFLKVKNTSVTRLHDQTTGYIGSSNISDYVVYKFPYQYFIECKSCHGNTFPFSNITDTQFNGLLEQSKIKGVRAGIICWWIDKDVTKFIPIQFIDFVKNSKEWKSIRYDFEADEIVDLKGKKKRVFFEYDMTKFFEEVMK